MSNIDSAVEIREGEELDIPKVTEFIKDNIPGTEGQTSIKQFPSGFSNLTYLIKIGESEFILRRPPFGEKAKTAHDMGREYNILTALQPVYQYSPQPLLYAEESDVMPAPFYVMERLKGIILRKELPDGLNLSKDQAKQLSENLVDVLCRLHSVDYDAIGLANFGKPEGYVERQVRGWSKRYIAAKTEDAPDCEKIMQWLHDNMPSDTDRPMIIHNDYKFDNVVLNPENPLEITGVLDWEMATLGNPLMDLGNSLAYWINRDDPPPMQLMRQMPTNIDGMLTRDEQINLYAQKMNIKIDNFDFYYCFGLFRLAVIAQQIYYRYIHGQTKDQRFRLLISGVKLLEMTASGVIEKSDQ